MTYVDIPFGAVGLYWLKQYLPLVLHHRLPQRPSGPGGYGWAREAFHRLRAVSPSDLRLGARFDADRAVILTRAINDACGNIEKMPVRYITHPGSANRQLFESGFSRVRATGRPFVLSRQYLGQFGRFRIPAPLWQALGQYACWLDPVIVREWRQLTANWNGTANRHMLFTRPRKWQARTSRCARTAAVYCGSWGFKLSTAARTARELSRQPEVRSPSRVVHPSLPFAPPSAGPGGSRTPPALHRPRHRPMRPPPGGSRPPHLPPDNPCRLRDTE